MRIIILLLLFLSCSVFAQEKMMQKPPKFPLGNCDAYSDYYIYKCQAFKCQLPISGLKQAFIELEVIKNDAGVCLFNQNFIVARGKKPPVTTVTMKCRLSEKGKLVAANQFTRYKEGDASAYNSPEMDPMFTKECNLNIM